jgi:hypothetical protein
MQYTRTNQNAGRFQPRLRTALSLTLALAALASGSKAFACATCGCSLSSDGALGYSTSTGWGISLDYNFINQNQYRSGGSTISPVAVYNSNPGNQEVENQTINRYLTLGVGYAPNADWSFRMLAPYIMRSHSTNGANLPDTGNLMGASVDSLGDMKIIASYQGFLPTHNLGMQFGVKLPTGDYGGQNIGGTVVGRNPVYFSGTTTLLDTSLQAGNGSTDIILGAYYYQPVSQNFDAFINGQYQRSVKQALNDTADGLDYRPGDTTTVSVGVRYEANPQIVPQLQINVTHKGADSGALADPIDVEGVTAYLSPGITVAATNTTKVYGFVQLPIYSYLSGYQLFPHYTASIGISHHF